MAAFKLCGMADLERQAQVLGRKTGRAALDRALTDWVNSIEWPKQVPDPEGEGDYVLKQWPRIVLNTAVGCVKLRIPSYWKKGKPCLRPVEAAWGLRKFVSPLLQRMCASIGAELPFATSETELKELAGVRLSASTIRSVCIEIGESALSEQLRPELPPAFGEPERITVFIDGGRVNTNEGWKEPRLARIELTNSIGAVMTFVLTRICGAEAFWALLEPILRNLGAETCRALAFLGDGAPWILSGAKARFSHALCILDFYHAAEHIHDAAKEIFGEGKKAKTWAKKYVKLLKRGRVDYLLYKLKSSRSRIAQRGFTAATALDSLLGYLEPRRDQLRYMTFRRRGFPIGSGKIEALVKQALNLRLKRNGAWWNIENADRILALRAVKLFGHLEQAWSARVRKRKQEVPEQFVKLLSSVHPPSLKDPCHALRKKRAA